MRNILTIIKKELKQVLSDRRLLISVVLLPGLLIYALYSIIGNLLSDRFSGESDKYSVAVCNSVDDFKPYANDFLTENKNYDFDFIYEYEKQGYLDKLYEGETDLIISFDEDFADSISEKETPKITVYYNPSESTSVVAYEKLSAFLKVYQKQKLEEIYNASDVFVIEDVLHFDEKKANGQQVAMLLPFLIITMLYSAAMGIAPESIAGDKERGTMATLLATPIKRTHLALGKIISLSILASLSALSSFLGTILSMPTLMGAQDISYSFLDYLSIFAIIITTVLIIVGLISSVSALAKNVKEASMLCMPLMVISMLVGIIGMISKNAVANHFLYCIPLYNSVQCMIGILSFEANAINIAITLATNVLFTTLFVFILTRMFNSEKVMFGK